ncbi:MAG: hypothetical protein KY467_08585 [Gemmatimonadetes bacterium]|nr:hypothetical protein [Gemmatimonadota bacterium]
MLLTRRLLGTAALALGTTLAACSDTGTSPQSGSDNPLVSQLNRLADGQGRVYAATAEEGKTAGAPEPVAGPSMALAPEEPCLYSHTCEPPPDPNCYDYCSWFDVDGGIGTGYTSTGRKYASLYGALYAYSDTYYADVFIDFYSAGGCNTPTRFDGTFLSGYNGSFTLSASRYIDYEGTFTWAVYVDGYAQNRSGQNGYETRYVSTCF